MVGLLAASAVFAGVNFSGRFRGGYVFTFPKDGNASIGPWHEGEGKLTVKASDDNGIWTVTLKGTAKTGTKFFDEDDMFNANAKINIDKLVSFLGGDMGDFSLALNVGNNSKMQGLTAYNGKSGGDYYKFKSAGQYMTEIQFGWADYFDLNVAFDPTFGADKVASIIVSAKTSPIEGLGISAAYTFNGYDKMYAALSDTPGDDELLEEIYFKNGIDVAASIDLAKMIGLDFNLGVEVHDVIALGLCPAAYNGSNDIKVNVNGLQAGVYGGIDLINAYAEYRLGLSFGDDISATYLVNGVKAGVKSSCGLDGFTAKVEFETKNFNNIANNFTVTGDVEYKLGSSGVVTGLELKYDAGKTAFSMTPRVVINF